MLEELSDSACERWCSRLNAELGSGTFKPEDTLKQQEVTAVPNVWVPSKPKVTLALLDEFVHASSAIVEKSNQIRVGSDTAISKLLARHAVERLREDKGPGWLRTCGELTAAQLDDPLKLTHALSRVAFDLLVYVHARALELKRQEEADVMIELHSSDQTLVGKAMRGCGVVYCERGREIFARAVKLVRDVMQPSRVDD